MPEGLNWDKWLGQTPVVDYIELESNGRHPHSRCHYEFRWWYEYSGGKLTDWGAHHVDIAQWAIGMQDSGPVKVEPVMAEHPVELKDGIPQDGSRYNTATKFLIKATFPNDVVMHIRHSAQDDLGFGNGIMFEGTKGRFLVNRGKIAGKPVEELEQNPLKEETIAKLYKGKQPGDHMRNFVECMVDREQPVSDVHTHHRALTTCHLANIAIRLGRTLNWDADQELIVDDREANAWQAREQREGYEIKA